MPTATREDARTVVSPAWRPMYGVVAAALLAVMVTPLGMLLLFDEPGARDAFGDLVTNVMLSFLFWGVFIVPAVIGFTAAFFVVVFLVGRASRRLHAWLFPAAGAAAGLPLAILFARDGFYGFAAYIVLAPAAAGWAFAFYARPPASDDGA